MANPAVEIGLDSGLTPRPALPHNSHHPLLFQIYFGPGSVFSHPLIISPVETET
ncbi:hypothetical protein B0H19DRAFT_1122682 [Mycena capillaripes]|nr:hypothetical protein B0H19DRAFT_1122682 [Mycena capillaripes]